MNKFHLRKIPTPSVNLQELSEDQESWLHEHPRPVDPLLWKMTCLKVKLAVNLSILSSDGRESWMPCLRSIVKHESGVSLEYLKKEKKWLRATAASGWSFMQ